MIFSKYGKAIGVVALAAVVSVVCLGSSAQAVNPAIWNDVYVETSGADASWDSATNVDTGWPFYDASFEVGFAGQLGGAIWIALGDSVGADNFPGPLPITFIDDHVSAEPVPGDALTEADILMWVDTSGQGHLSLTNLVLGTFAGTPITGLKMGAAGITQGTEPGILTVEGLLVPEPASIALIGLALAALAAVRRRM